MKTQDQSKTTSKIGLPQDHKRKIQELSLEEQIVKM